MNLIDLLKLIESSLWKIPHYSLSLLLLHKRLLYVLYVMKIIASNNVYTFVIRWVYISLMDMCKMYKCKHIRKKYEACMKELYSPDRFMEY